MSEKYWPLIYKPATLVFRTVHIDKAGETSDHCVLEAEVADVNEDGIALLVTRNGVPVHVPVAALFPAYSADSSVDAQSYLGGHELIRSFHPEPGAARTEVRWLSRPEIEALLPRCKSVKSGTAAYGEE